MKITLLHFIARLFGVLFVYEIRHLAAGYKRTESRGTLIFTTDDPHLALSRFEEIKANEASHKEGEGYYLAVQTRLAAFGSEAGKQAPARQRSRVSGPATTPVEPGRGGSDRDESPQVSDAEATGGSRSDDRQDAGAGTPEGLTADARVASDWQAPMGDKDIVGP